MKKGLGRAALVSAWLLTSTLAARPASATGFAREFAPEFDGLWIRACEAGAIRSEEFAADAVVYTERYFSTAGCLGPRVFSRSYGRYALPAPSQMDFEFTKVTLEPVTEAVAESMRVSLYCGTTDWVAGRETEVTGLECDLTGTGKLIRLPRAGEMRYGIYRLGPELGALYLGKISQKFPATSPETRPVELDPIPYRRRR